jgi:hypothetical protein
MNDAGALAIVAVVLTLLALIASIVFGVIKVARMASERDSTLTAVGNSLGTRISEMARELEGKLGEESKALRKSLDDMGRSLTRLETTMQEAVLPRLTHMEDAYTAMHERILRIETMKWREMAGMGGIEGGEGKGGRQ